MSIQEIPSNRQDRSLGELFADLIRETTTLIHQEVSLAKVELSEKVASVGKNVGFLAVGGAIAYAGLLALIAALILGLIQTGLPAWVSALIVGVIVAAIGGILVSMGLAAFKKMDITPKQTVETLKEDVQWAKEQTR